jgi:chromate transport protein ChrA
MTPVPFTLDMEKVFQLCVYLVVLSIFLERALALVFEHRWMIQRDNLHGKKELITFIVAFFICWKWDFDAFAVLNNAAVTHWGMVLSAMILAGGTKGSMKLMQDVLGIKRTPEEIQKILAEKKP